MQIFLSILWPHPRYHLNICFSTSCKLILKFTVIRSFLCQESFGFQNYLMTRLLNTRWASILFIYYCWTRKTLWYIQKYLQYIIVEFPPPSFSFITSSPHSCNSFNSSHFYIYMHVYSELLWWCLPYSNLHWTLSLLYTFIPKEFWR
jgi:hypothetical protein